MAQTIENGGATCNMAPDQQGTGRSLFLLFRRARVKRIVTFQISYQKIPVVLLSV